MFRCGKTSFSVDRPGDAVGSPIVSSAAEGSGPRWAASQSAPGDPVLSNNFQRICPSKEGSLCNSGEGARGVSSEEEQPLWQGTPFSLLSVLKQSPSKHHDLTCIAIFSTVPKSFLYVKIR